MLYKGSLMITQLINERAVSLGANATDKSDILRQAAVLLAGIQDKGGPNADDIYRLLSDREGLGSTGIGGGLAIPHATIDGSGDFKLALLTVPAGVAYDSLDGKPVTTIFAMLGPAERRSTHVRILASLSRMMKNPDFVGKLLAASSYSEAVDLFRNAEEPEATAAKTVEKSLLTAVIQNDEYLEPLLEILTGISESEIIVLEGHGAGRYLHALPLFSMFWTDESRKTESKVVTAVIDRHTGNEAIRQISAGVVDPSRDSGLMITIQDLSLVTGSLEL